MSDQQSARKLGVLLAAVSEVAGGLSGRGSYAVAYGSHAAGQNNPRSDLDLLQVVPVSPSPRQLRRLIETVVGLHHDHGLDLDTEVTYEIKLVADHSEVMSALHHESFPMPYSTRHPLVNAVPADPVYLNSETFKLRLILNALTTPNMFLGGDHVAFSRHTRIAQGSAALLAMRILAYEGELTTFTLGDCASALTQGPGGTEGKDFLGYRPSAHLLTTLNQGLHQLVRVGLTSIDAVAVWTPGPAWAGSATTTSALRYCV